MSNSIFSVYHGSFICQICQEEVKTLRLWQETLDLTWACTKKHISKASFAYKTKKDYEREKRE